jgi:hypothetical protein
MRSILEFVLTRAATQPCGLSNTDSGPSADELQATHSGVPDSTLAFIQNANMPGHRCADIMQGAAVMRFDFSDPGMSVGVDDFEVAEARLNSKRFRRLAATRIGELRYAERVLSV